jgi:hypothetical protein
MTVSTLKNLYNEYLKKEEISDAADEAWENDYESEELEAAFDKAYKEQAEAMNEVINGIVEITNGQIDKRTAHTMILKGRDTLTKLFSMTA